MKFYGKTDVGVRRTENQDCFGIFEILPGVTLLAVCDGMGGVAGGAIASRLALDTFAQSMREHILPDNPEDEPDLGSIGLRFALSASASDANRAVYREAKESDGKFEDMGTTLVALLVVENTLAYSLNIGDSRMYDISEGKITQLTKDHSYVQQLVDMGQITYEEAKTSPMRNIITRAVGIDGDVVADIHSLSPAPGFPDAPHYILLCSDGLCGVISDEEIADIVCSDGELRDKTERLVTAANNAGGPDNITVVIAEL
jgi:protein phosphatase